MKKNPLLIVIGIIAAPFVLYYAVKFLLSLLGVTIGLTLSIITWLLPWLFLAAIIFGIWWFLRRKTGAN